MATAPGGTAEAVPYPRQRQRQRTGVSALHAKVNAIATRDSASKVRGAVPYQLHRNRQDEESEDAVDRTHRSGSEALDEWTSQPQQQVNGETERDDSDYHADIGKKVVYVGGETHDYADRAWAG